ncbi:MAG: DUF1700 domain-containing protein [Candidatus Methanomethylophilaceae archaeon]|nr:DUF1700 domain-containing protein [Candidatus Methanomethylophilaceae archaeon]
MNKQEFLSQLRNSLAGLPQEDIDERLGFYDEMIDDRIEDGLTEEEAVAEIGPIEAIVPQIVADIPLPKLVKERMKPKRRLSAGEIVLLILGAPLWFPLLVAAFAILLSIYIVIWSVIISLWAVEVSFIVSAVAGVIGGIVLICMGRGAEGLTLIGGGLVLAGLSVFLYFGCLAASKGTIILTKKIALWIKSLFIRKESSK